MKPVEIQVNQSSPLVAESATAEGFLHVDPVVVAANPALFSPIRAFKKVLAVFLLLSAVAGFFSSPLYNALKLGFAFYDPIAITEYRLRRLSPEDYVTAINAALEADDLEDAKGIVDLAEEYGYKLPQELIDKTQLGVTQNMWRYSKQFIDGVANGDAGSPAAISGSMAADFFVIGDIRDFTKEGSKAVVGDDYDKVTLSLAAAGLLMTGSGPADIGSSMLKTLKKTNRLGAPLLEKLTKVSRSVVDTEKLKLAMTNLPKFKLGMPGLGKLKSTLESVTFADINKADFSKLKPLAQDVIDIDVSAFRRSMQGVVNPVALKELGEFTSSATIVTYRGGIKGGFRAIELSDSPRDISKFAKVSGKFGYTTSSVLRLIGKGAIKLGELVYHLVAALTFLIVWMVGAVFSIFGLVLKLRYLLK